MFQDLKIHAKLLIGLSLIVLFVIVSGLVGFLGVRRTSHAFHSIADVSAPALQTLLEIKSVVHEIEALTITFESSNFSSTVSEDTRGGDEKFSLLEKIEKLEMWTESYRIHESTANPSELSLRLLEEIHELKDRVVTAALDYVDLKEQGVTDSRVSFQREKLEGVRTRLKEVIREAMDEELKNFSAQRNATTKTVDGTVKINLMVAIVALVFVLFIGILLANSIAKPIVRLRNIVSAMARGELSRRVAVESNDEVGELSRSFNAMADQIEREIDNRKREEEKKRLIIETANDAFVAIDSKGLIIEWNRQAEKIFGWQRSEVLGHTLTDLIIPGQYREAHRKGLERYLATGEGPVLNRRVELSASNVRGHEFPVELTIWPVHVGGTVSFNSFIQDLTDRKRLESTVIQSEKMAMAGQLAFGVAHEVKNPLAILLQGVEYLRKHGKSTDKEASLLLEDMTHAIEHADNVVRGLLELGRPVGFSPKPENLESIIENALLLLRRQLGVSHVHVVKKFEAGFPKVFVDRGKMLGLFINLLSNAVEAIPSGGSITITAALQKLTTAGSQVGRRKEDAFKVGQEVVIIRVEDTGSGISEDALPHVFDPFYTTRRGKGGTGLGLSVARNIVQIHQGTIEITNRKEGGARVTIMLPVG